MLTFNEKPLEELTLEETIEFEKLILKRMQAAAGMSENVQFQLHNFYNTIKMHKAEKVAELQANSNKDKDKLVAPLIIGDIDEIEQESSSDSE